MEIVIHASQSPKMRKSEWEFQIDESETLTHAWYLIFSTTQAVGQSS